MTRMSSWCPRAHRAGRLVQCGGQRCADLRHGLADNPGQQAGGVSRRRPGCRLAGARGVEAQHRVEVHAAPRLVLGHLRKRQAHLSAQRRPRQPDRPRQRAVQVDGGPSPQLGGDRVPEHRALVVEAVRADRAAQQRIALAVALLAAQGPAVRAAASRMGSARSRSTAGVQATAVHRPEAGRGQGDEQPRVLGHRLRHPLASAQPGGD